MPHNNHAYWSLKTIRDLVALITVKIIKSTKNEELKLKEKTQCTCTEKQHEMTDAWEKLLQKKFDKLLENFNKIISMEISALDKKIDSVVNLITHASHNTPILEVDQSSIGHNAVDDHQQRINKKT